jgi:hypothetical protein
VPPSNGERNFDAEHHRETRRDHHGMPRRFSEQSNAMFEENLISFDHLAISLCPPPALLQRRSGDCGNLYLGSCKLVLKKCATDVRTDQQRTNSFFFQTSVVKNYGVACQHRVPCFFLSSNVSPSPHRNTTLASGRFHNATLKRQQNVQGNANLVAVKP